MPLSKLTKQQRATITDRARVWEVRRFCQVLPSVVKYVRGSDAGLMSMPLKRHGRYMGSEPDGALAALLRCIVQQTGADLAMVSLLDDHTQYFISGASRANADDTKITLEDSTKWYGCESVTHHGGLCERTITRHNQPGNMAIYEELDMAELERTKNLPFVRGDIAKFRHYVGVPLNPYGGQNIGTVFIFSSTPSENGLSTARRLALFETASHIIRHLEQAVEALEGKRVLRFNQGVASLLRMGSSAGLAARSAHEQPLPESPNRQHSLVSNLYDASALRLYHLSATLLYDAFEFDGVRIQESGSSGNLVNRNPAWNGSSILAEYLGPGAHKPQSLSYILIGRLLDLFPQGAVFQVLDKNSKIVVATSASTVALVDDPVISTELSKSFPTAVQIVLMPLWDTFHERNIGAVLGFANTQARVYLGSTDLASISAFCMTIMTQVRRLEAQAMDKIKSDFLGSVSHEMRTPLHGMLSSLELLADTTHNAHQHDLLETAKYSGLSLLDTIERVLYFSNISSGSHSPDHLGSDASRGLVYPSGLVHHKPEASPRESDSMELIGICEEIIHSESRRLCLKEAVQSELSIGAIHVPIIVFDTNATWPCHLKAVGSFRVILMNLINNALKFGQSTNCIRVSLNFTTDFVDISCMDAGQGIAFDFVRHSIFDPFSQEDPVTEGTGLGLTIVKQTATMLGGDVRIESSKKQGSTFTVRLPSARLLHGPLEGAAGDVNTKSSTAELPRLDVSLFTPRRWETGDAVRDQRRLGLLLDSLTQGLRRWFYITVIPWESASISSYSRLLIALKEDEDCARLTYGGTFDVAERILLHPDVQPLLSPYTTPCDKITTIAGAVTISKLQAALSHLFPDIVSSSKLHRHLEEISATGEYQNLSGRGRRNQSSREAADISDDPPASSLSNLVLGGKPQVDSEESAMHSQSTPEASQSGALRKEASKKPVEARSPKQKRQAHKEQAEDSKLSKPSKGLAAEPKLLLVDDNAVNLKVLAMYARKCSKTPATSAGGGQEAIDAFKSTMEPDDGERAQPFDLIFLDLSMPEVSGFDVAREIREIEARLKRDRTYICALTGLVSGKDRNAAYESGVDNYLIRPTGLRDLQEVIELWRQSSSR